MSRSLAFVLFVVLCALAECLPAVDEDLFVIHFATGPAWDDALPPGEQVAFREHSSNLGRLRREGRIVFGARYGDLGMIFLRAASEAAAREEIAADPGVTAGLFTFELAPLSVFYPWQE